MQHQSADKSSSERPGFSVAAPHERGASRSKVRLRWGGVLRAASIPIVPVALVALLSVTGCGAEEVVVPQAGPTTLTRSFAATYVTGAQFGGGSGTPIPAADVAAQPSARPLLCPALRAVIEQRVTSSAVLGTPTGAWFDDEVWLVERIHAVPGAAEVVAAIGEVGATCEGEGASPDLTSDTDLPPGSWGYGEVASFGDRVQVTAFYLLPAGDTVLVMTSVGQAPASDSTAVRDWAPLDRATTAAARAATA